MVCKHVLKKVEVVKGVIRIRKSKKSRQCQKKNDKRRNNGRQNITQTTKDCATQNLLRTVGGLGRSGKNGTS